ncbi:MAG: bifunctional enoyl-CoA hydratase/phosphate acetyltransferase [Defluviitaleaceae bacterium]|nr:bifunctional enoyl-CoA hydratase/phosphate acetyltransferase [Defluviitaleaceae bacterium]
MLSNFSDIIKLTQNKKNKISVAVAQDAHVLEAVKIAKEQGIADFVLVGDKQKIEELTTEKFEIIHETDAAAACKIAVDLVNQGETKALMKGLVDTSVVMKAALNKEHGMRTGKNLSHIAAFEVAVYHKLLFVADAAINIAPDINTKKEILQNCVEALNNLGLSKPKVALLAAKEKVDPKMQVTLEYEEIIKDHKGGFLQEAIIDGPLALDNAVSKESCAIKGINSPVGGDADLLFCPDIEAGNILYKSLAFLAGAKSGGVVLGAKRPIILTSRADSTESKTISIALSLLF